jgi:putative salt-induced outer membrane protein YdiY
MRHLVLIGVLGSLLMAGRLELQQGAIEGSLVGFKEGAVIFETAFSQTLTIDPAAVVKLEGDESMQLRTIDDQIHNGVPVLTSEGVEIGGASVAYGAIYRMQPEADLKKLQMSGFVDLALQRVSGNAKSESTTVDAGLNLRKEVHRHTLRATLSMQESEEETIEDKEDYSYRYDRFVSVKWYLYGTVAYGSDFATQLDNRQAYGLGVGHQFLENDTTAIAIGLGANRVFEKYDGAETERDTAAQLTMEFSHWLFGDRVELFHDNQTLFFPDREDDYHLVARTGTRIGLAEGLTASLQHRDEVRRYVAEGADKHDRTLSVALGYRW